MWTGTFLLGSAVGPSVLEFAQSYVYQLTPRVAGPGREALLERLVSDGTED